jgi:hypothetical protein
MILDFQTVRATHTAEASFSDLACCSSFKLDLNDPGKHPVTSLTLPCTLHCCKQHISLLTTEWSSKHCRMCVSSAAYHPLLPRQQPRQQTARHLCHNCHKKGRCTAGTVTSCCSVPTGATCCSTLLLSCTGQGHTMYSWRFSRVLTEPVFAVCLRSR